MAVKLAALKFGSPVCFEDRWKGKVASLDVTEDWEVLNLTVSARTLFSQQAVKLPVTAVKAIEDDGIYIAVSSFRAFAREVPPIAAPSRPVSNATLLSTGGFRLAGVILSVTDATYGVSEILVSRSFTTYRVPIEQIAVQAATLTLTSASDELTEFQADSDILDQVKRLISSDRHITPDDKSHITPSVAGGSISLDGNVRVRVTREHVAALAEQVPGVISVQDNVVDDLDLEAAIGSAILREGLAQARAYARSSLGQVTLYGTVASPRQAADIQRTVARVPGVRAVINRLTTNAGAAIGLQRGVVI